MLSLAGVRNSRAIMNSQTAVLKVSNITKKIESNFVIHNLSFSLPKGKILAILGPNGAGKTTLIRIILGLYTQDEGTVYMFGKKVSKSNIALIREQIGVQNDGNIYEELSVYDNLRIWARLYGCKQFIIDPRIDELIDFLDLHTKKFKLAGTLSKGMRQKVNLARALFHNPKLLILDEPTSGLDPLSIEKLMKFLQKLTHEYGTSIIMCTHQLSGLENIADYLGVINHGKLIAYGETQMLLKERWSEPEYLMKLRPIDKAIDLCSKHWDCRVQENKMMVKVPDACVPKITKLLVMNDIEIYKIAKIEHTIKELYAHYIERE